MAEPVLLRMPFSHYCRKAEWGLTLAGVPYTTIDVKLVRMADLYRANPEGTVPVLKLGDDLHFGSHAVLRHAEAHQSPVAPSLYPPRVRAEVEAWESWVDSTVGSAVRREAYRALHAKPSLAKGHDLPLWMRLPFARRFYLTVLKLLKARRYDAEDRKALEAAIALTAQRLAATGTGYLYGSTPTAADVATAALLEPLVPIAAHLGYDKLPGWPAVAALVDRVRPSTTTCTKSRRITEADWREFERLNAVAKPVAMPGLRCECGVPDWKRIERTEPN